MDDLDNISQLNVLILGAGGLGTEIAQLLVLSGIRRLTIVDFDTIELSNLNRQFLFTPDTIGQFKVHVLKEALLKYPLSLPSPLSITALTSDIMLLNQSFYSQFDITFGGLDSLEPRSHSSHLLAITQQPYVDSGVVGLTGGIRIYYNNTHTHPSEPCFQCTRWMYPNAMQTIALCSAAGVPRDPHHCVLHAAVIAYPELHGRSPEISDQVDMAELVRLTKLRAGPHGITCDDWEAAITHTLNHTIPAVGAANAMVAGAAVHLGLRLVRGDASLKPFYAVRADASPVCLPQELLPDPYCPCRMARDTGSRHMAEISVGRHETCGELGARLVRLFTGDISSEHRVAVFCGTTLVFGTGWFKDSGLDGSTVVRSIFALPVTVTICISGQHNERYIKLM